MKVLFAGPSLYRASVDLADIELRPPAAHGDIAKATVDGADVIGLIDGNFEAVAAVWHKEILFALSEGVTVYGAASMGALRAAECAAFGMIPIGKIANAYVSGELDDDAAVAIAHGPTDLGSPPLTESLVDAEATLVAMRNSDCINHAQFETLLGNARNLFFKDRTIPEIVAVLSDPAYFETLYRENHVNQKQADALELVETLKARFPKRTRREQPWKLAQPATWKIALNRITSIAS